MFKFIALLSLSSLLYAAPSNNKVIYGDDNRLDLYEVKNNLFRTLAKSTAGMVSLDMLQDNGDTFALNRLITLEQGLNVCSSEKFADQPLAANCSGFLVSENILVTAGHCYSGRAANSCRTHAWVFDYAMESRSSINTDLIEKENVYFCKKVVKVKFDNQQDFAIIELDRKVTNRKPVKLRKTGKVQMKTPLVVIGHPSMLPTKVSPGGTVLLNNDQYQFTTTLDTFQGNSGSAVFNAKTGEVEGILVSGKTDYVPVRESDPNSCMVVNKCDMKGDACDGKDRGSLMIPGENVTRITTLLKYLP
tara:strand:+ start:24948 stop:25859 length:912 start_codon:yes stop_codon:yes gene_type:complete